MAALLAAPELVGLDLKIRIVHGHPNPVLLDITNEMGADLIVAGKHGGSRLEESVMGSITRLFAYIVIGLRELHFTGEVAVVAREEFDGAALKRLGAPTLLYPMRNAVDYAVEALTAIIRSGGAAS